MAFSLLADHPANINKVDLFTYAEIVSSATNQNILIDNKVPAKQISFFAPSVLNKNDYLQTFKDLLKDSKLRLIKRKNYYYVTLPLKPDMSLHSYKFKNLNIDDVKFLKNIFPDIQFQFFKNSNTLFFVSDYQKFIAVNKICKNIDLPYLSKDIQLTIFITDLDKLKHSGVNYENFGIDFTGLLQLTENGIDFTTTNIFKFKGLLDSLKDKKIVEIVQNPVIHLTDNKKSSFDVVKNIPIYISSTSVDDNKITTQKQIQYRDIGLKIKINPKIYKDYILLDLNLTSETIDDLTETPVTNKLHYANSFKMKKSDAILLSGLNVSQTHTQKQRIPILADLPYISPLFKSTTTQTKHQVLSILIETIE